MRPEKYRISPSGGLNSEPSNSKLFERLASGLCCFIFAAFAGALIIGSYMKYGELTGQSLIIFSGCAFVFHWYFPRG